MVLERLVYVLPEFAQCWNHSRFGQFHQMAFDKLGEHFALNVDCEAWDAHVGPDLLEVQDFFFKLLLRDHTPDDKLFLSLRSAICTYLGTGRQLRLTDMRFSGDMHTSLGNGVLNVILTRWILHRLGIPKSQWCYAVKGDDSDVRLSARPDLGKLEEMYRSVGMVAKAKIVPWYESEFASVYYLPNKDGMHGYRVPWKILTRVPYLVGRFRPKAAAQRSLGVATCEYLENVSCPVISALVDFWFRTASSVCDVPLFESEFRRKQSERNARYHDIDVESRIGFERLFGISICQQLEVEEMLHNLSAGQSIPDHGVWAVLLAKFVDESDFKDSDRGV